MEVSADRGQQSDLSSEPSAAEASWPLLTAHPEFRVCWREAPVRAEHPEVRLSSLAHASGALRRVLAAVAARLLDTKAHDRLCYARLGDYARERLGLSGRQLQELARVHRALEGLPALERALREKALPWSKVRLVARVATAEDEAAWIARARAVTTRRLEEEVREHDRARGAADPDEGEPLTRITVPCTPAVRETWSLVREMAQRVEGRKLCDAEVLEAAVAEVCSTLPIDPAFTPLLDEPPPARALRSAEVAELAKPKAGPGDAADAAGRASACELPAEVAALADGLEDADVFELDRRLRALIRLEQTLDAAMAPLLRVVTGSEYEWRGPRYQPLARYAPDQLGMSVSKARALIRLDRLADFCPEIRAAYRSGRLSWVKAQCLLPLLLLDIPGEWRPAWVAWAEHVTVRRLERDVERALLLRAGHSRAFHRCQYHPERAQDPIPASERQLCAHDVDPEATERLVLRVPQAVAALFQALRETVRKRRWRAGERRLQEGEAFEAILCEALRSWVLRDPKARRPDPVIERDGYQCAIPGCTSRRNLHNHHVVFRSRRGGDEETNRLTLCAYHHQRCVHAELLRVTGKAPAALLFELGLRSGAPPLLRYRSGDIEVRPAMRGVRRARVHAA